ncbi:hypothetical protein [Salinibacterium xinjiangense]|nr:hypothetical protein [Salinibacterium xinjiangense]
MRRLTTRRIVESLPTLELSPKATPMSGKVVETRSSRFAPAEDTLPPAASITANTAANIAANGPTMVTAVPVFASPSAPRRSTRPAGSPAMSAEPTTAEPMTAEPMTAEPVNAEPVSAASMDEPLDVRMDALPAATTLDPAIEETTGTPISLRQASRPRNSRQAGPVKVTVGRYSAVRGNTASILRERIARETYALKSRELERAADERLAFEQQLVERRIREQLEASQRELHWSLDEILEDTVILPRSIRDSENS